MLIKDRQPPTVALEFVMKELEIRYFPCLSEDFLLVVVSSIYMVPPVMLFVSENCDEEIKIDLQLIQVKAAPLLESVPYILDILTLFIFMEAVSAYIEVLA